MLRISFVGVKCAQKVHPFPPLHPLQLVKFSSAYISKQVMGSGYQVLVLPGWGLVRYAELHKANVTKKQKIQFYIIRATRGRQV